MSRAEAATLMSVQPLTGSLVVVVESYSPLVTLISTRQVLVVACFDRKGHGPGDDAPASRASLCTSYSPTTVAVTM